MEEGWFLGHGGTPIFHRSRVPDGARAAVLVLHGYSEHGGRHARTIDHLAAHGIASFAPDHRGHGRTARVLGLMDDVDAVIADIGILHRRVLERLPGVPVFVLAHSMGGLLALRYLELHGDGLRGAIVNGPGIEVPASIPRPVILASRVLSRVVPALPVQPFHEGGRGNTDPAQQAIDAADPLQYCGRIRVGTGAAMYRAIRRTRAELDRIRTPILLTGGTDDRTVSPSAPRFVFDRVGSRDRTLHMFDGLRHEVWLEPQHAEVFGVWRAWIEARLG